MPGRDRPFRGAAKYELSKKVLRGTGTNQPQGIIAATDINDVARQTVNQVVHKDLTNLLYAVAMARRLGGRFILDDSVEKYLVQLEDGQGRTLFTTDMSSGPKYNLAGYPYTAHEYGPTLGTEGDVVFGNPQQYALAVEEDIAIARSEHAEFKKGLVVFRMIMFVGGKPIFGDSFSHG